MNITYLDADTREVIEFMDHPETLAPAIMQRAAEFAGVLDATVLKITPHQDENEWTVELKVPLKVRREHTALPGDRVLFRAAGQEHELIGTYQFRGRLSYIVLDDSGGEWEVQSMWQMKKQ